MRKIKSHLGEHLKPVKLYKEDIVEIYRILSKLEQEINVQVNEYELEGIHELDEVPDEKVSTLSFSSSGENYVSLKFDKSSLWIYANDNSPAQRGVYQELKDFLVGKKDYLSIILHMHLFSGAYTGFSFWFLIDALKKGENELLNWGVGLFILLTGSLWGIYGVRKSLNRFSRIFIHPRPCEKNFFIRNSDSLLIMLITVALTTAGAFLVAKWMS